MFKVRAAIAGALAPALRPARLVSFAAAVAMASAPILEGEASAAAAPSSPAPRIYDYMVMDVCVDGADRAIAGLAPGDVQCTRHRNAVPGETVSYELHNFRPHAHGCAQSLGTIAKVNIPVAKAGVTRIVSSYNHNLSGECDGDPSAGSPGGGLEGGASVQWFDGRYGYIMGSWSPVALSSFVGALCPKRPATSLRFAEGWVIGPTSLPPQPRVYGYVSLPGALATGAPDLAAPCPPLNHAGLTTWVRDRFSFSSGLTMDAVISEHFSRTSDAGDAPGDAQQVERTYWSSVFGLSRWEKWARDDWINPRNHMTAFQQAQAEYRSGDCDAPYSIDTVVSPHLTYQTATAPGVFARTMIQPGQRGLHSWYMTLCEDYTHVVKLSGGAKPVWEDGLSDAYWVN